MKIIVTGGRGFLGTHLSKKLISLGHEVHTIGRSKVEETYDSNNKCFHHCNDLIKDNLPQAVWAGTELIFHVAAKAGIWGNYNEFYKTNVVITEKILKACENFGIPKLIYTSTPSVVFSGHPIRNGDESLAYGKTDLSPYAETKAIAERKVLNANINGKFQTIALRPHLVWGNGDPHLLPRVISRHRSGKLKIVGDGKNYVDLTHIENVTHAHICAMQAMLKNKDLGGYSFFIGQGEPVNLWSWLNEMFGSVGLPTLSNQINHKNAYFAGRCLEKIWSILKLKGEPPMTRFVACQLAHDHWFSINSAKEKIGYQPIISMKDALDKSLPWLRSL